MNFRLVHKSEVSAQLLAEHPIWAQYHEPTDLKVITEWGVPLDGVTGMFEDVHWSDSYIFPVLRTQDVWRFYFSYAAAKFQLPNGAIFSGFVTDDHPRSACLFIAAEWILLSQGAPAISEEDEAQLKRTAHVESVYPMRVISCVCPLQHYTLNPYAQL